MVKNPINKSSVKAVKALDGIYRKTLAYNDSVMMCFFNLKKGAEIPLHNHISHQIGYVIKGKIKLFTETYEFIAIEGDSYVFNTYEKHGAHVLDDTDVIEVFNPTREDYK